MTDAALPDPAAPSPPGSASDRLDPPPPGSRTVLATATAAQAAVSIVNFGLPSLSGQTASTLDISDLERAIRQTILEFEPRILPDTLVVTALVELSQLDHHNVIGIEIHGELWAQPLPMELLIRTEIDLETGKAHIADLAPSRAG